MTMKRLLKADIWLVISILTVLSLTRGGSCACLEGLPNRTVAELASFVKEGLNDGEMFFTKTMRQYVFLSLNFSCYGTITKWRIAASDEQIGGGRPELGIWRQSTQSPNRYNNIAAQFMDACDVKRVHTNDTDIVIHENYIDLSFDPGDILGLYVRRSSIFELNPYFQQDDGNSRSCYVDSAFVIPESVTCTQNQVEEITPLLSVDICLRSNDLGEAGYPLCEDLPSVREEQQCGTSPTTSLMLTSIVSPSPTMTPPSPDPSSGSSSGLSMELLIIIIAVPAGLLAIVLVVGIVIVVLCCVCPRRSWEPEKHQTPNGNEFAYADTPLTIVTPTPDGMNHLYDRPLPVPSQDPRKNSYVLTVHNDLYGSSLQPRGHDVLQASGDRDKAAFDYEEPIAALSQVASSEFLHSGQGHNPLPYTPTLPVPGATFNFTPQFGTFGGQTSPRGRHSPNTLPVGSTGVLYHTLEGTPPAPLPPRSQSRLGTNDSNRMKPQYRMRSQSTDELSYRPKSGSTSREYAEIGAARSIDELSRPKFKFTSSTEYAKVGLSQVAPGNNVDDPNYEVIDGLANRKQVISPIDSGIYVPSQQQRTDVESREDQQPVFDDNIYACFREREADDPHSPLGPDPTFFEESAVYWKPAVDTTGLYDQLSINKYREIFRKQIKITKHLGSGEFGTVCKGIWESSKGRVDVAVKMLNLKASEKAKIRFLQEAAIMGQFRHHNIVRLHGVVTVGEPAMIVLELMKHGDLRRHLKLLRPAPGEMAPSHLPQKVLEYCSQIALGMEYLARKEFIHRDLAARNVLLSEDNVCKIADFGMSRDLDDDDYYISHGGRIPIKWTAPEALSYRKYSPASDVWSFGCLLYEVWSLGHSPFRHQSPEETIQMVEDGHRMAPPPGCPRQIYTLMVDCWHPEALHRPTFTEVVQTLSQSDTIILKWSPEDTKHHPQACTLGAPMEIGEVMFPELHKKYMTQE